MSEIPEKSALLDNALAKVTDGVWSRSRAAEELNMSEFEFSETYGDLIEGRICPKCGSSVVVAAVFISVPGDDTTEGWVCEEEGCLAHWLEAGEDDSK